MSENAFQAARDALTILEFNGSNSASSQAAQDQKAEVVTMLRHEADTEPEASFGRKLLLNLANLIEQL